MRRLRIIVESMITKCCLEYLIHKENQMGRIEHSGGRPEAMEKFLEEFKKVLDADGFLASVWVLRGDKIQLTCCTAHDFPLELRPVCEEQLREVNQNEARHLMTPPPPLPSAPGFSSLPDSYRDLVDGAGSDDGSEFDADVPFNDAEENRL